MKAAVLLLSATCLGFAFLHGSGASPRPVTVSAGGTSAVINRQVLSPSADAATIVAKAQAFKATLSAAQISTLQQTYTSTLARKWSNLPCGASCRNGVQFSTLTDAQLAAALEVIQAAAGTALNEGYDEFGQIRTADSLLGVTSGGNNYSKGIYFISFLNEPSTTGPWMLQYGGHHYAANIAFNNGAVIGATPLFEGVEPKSFVATNGRTYAPIDQEHAGMVAMLASLSATQLSSAQLTSSFGDVLLGPNQDGKFPATKQGLAVSTLSDAQKLLVLDAMRPWVSDVDDATAATLLAIYQNELNGTYIAWSGGSTLSANGNYARIDGPSVWIEFVCQNGVVFPNQIHYHTIWRDHTRDYGADLSGTLLSVREEAAPVSVSSVYPNPARDVVTISLRENVTGASVHVFDDQGHQVLSAVGESGSSIRLGIAGLANGAYMVRIDGKGKSYSGRFTKVR